MSTDMNIDTLNVNIFESREELGQYAAEAVAARIKDLLKSKPFINMIFAAAPSQNEFLAALTKEKLEWNKINAFHMDEYVSLKEDAPQGFGNFLRQHIFNRAAFRSIHFLNGNAGDLQQECDRYSALLEEYPTDIVCMGIGENTHIAFNDPHVADFNDPKMVKVVDLDQECRQQQVNDGCFHHIQEVPKYALTLTVPALFKSVYVYCIVPGKKKATAIYHTLNQKIDADFPSTILRTHSNAMLFIDKDSSSLIH